MNILVYSLVFFPMAAGLLCYAIGRINKNMRDIFADIVTGITLGLSLLLLIQTAASRTSGTIVAIPYVCGMGLHFTIDGFRAVYGTVASFMWFMSTLFSREYFTHYRNRNRYYLFLLLTLGATEGVFLSADLYTTFIFFEIMSFTSYVWVAQDERKESLRAAATYLAVAVIGGLAMLMGIFLLYDVTGTLFFNDLTGAYLTYGLLSSRSYDGTQLLAAGLCLLFGFGAKAGAFPLHIWLPKAHPVAPAPASALLSGILTKAGMYGILILTAYIFLGDAAWGSLILVIGVCTMVTGAVLALFSVDVKRTLACSSVSQIGFILVGVGMSGLLTTVNVAGQTGTPDGLTAIRGSLLHMVNHSLIKLVLFMAAGVIYMNVHKLNLNDIRGFGRKKPLLNCIFLMGALGIGGVPLWNGYISKTLIHESIAGYTEWLQNTANTSLTAPYLDPALYLNAGVMKAVEWIFLISGGLTIAYMTKLYVAIFIEKNSDETVQDKFDALKGTYMNKVSAFSLTLSAALLPLMGFLPHVVMDRIADMGQSFMMAYDAPGIVPFISRPQGSYGEIAYFSMENIKGAAISLGIGALVYLIIVRLWLMKDGRYVNRWHRYLDLENTVYRPLLLKILPFLSGVICRVLDCFVDTVVVLLRKTVYRDSKLPRELPEGTPLTHLAACIAACFRRIGDLIFRRKHSEKVDYDHKYALFHEEWSENTAMITRSMSFGLLLFCIGLLAMVGYLFVMDIF